jgi:hypothetical protein
VQRQLGEDVIDLAAGQVRLMSHHGVRAMCTSCAHSEAAALPKRFEGGALPGRGPVQPAAAPLRAAARSAASARAHAWRHSNKKSVPHHRRAADSATPLCHQPAPSSLPLDKIAAAAAHRFGSPGANPLMLQ